MCLASKTLTLRKLTLRIQYILLFLFSLDTFICCGMYEGIYLIVGTWNPRFVPAICSWLMVSSVFFSETHCPYPISSPVFRPILSSLACQCSSSLLKWISSAHSFASPPYPSPALPSLASSLVRSLGIGGTTVPLPSFLPSFLPRCRCRQATPTDRVHDFCRIMRLARSTVVDCS